MKRKDNKQFVKEVKELVGDEYTPLTEYTTCHNKILMKHNICGYEYLVAPNKFTSQGRRCPKCSNQVPLTIDDIRNDIKVLGNDEYELLSNEYKNNLTPLKIRHIKCGNEYMTNYANFKYNENRCPKCRRKISKGEQYIKDFLEENNINFDMYVNFEDFKSDNGKLLEFDFWLEEFNMVIEYDGEQHFRPFRSSNKEENERKFRNLQKCDKLKNELLEENNINLVRFNYKQTKKQIHSLLKLILRL